MTVYRDIDLSKGLNDEQAAMLREAAAAPAVPDEDCPKLTDEQLAKFAEAARQRRQKLRNKQTVAVRLSPQALNKAKSLGKGYTSVLSRILEDTLADNEVLKRYL